MRTMKDNLDVALLSLCSGYGGLELGMQLACPGAHAVCYVEREAFAVANLVAAMEAGQLAPAPVWGELSTFNGKEWRGLVDGVTAGFPCQPWSAAGKKEGKTDDRWLWPHIDRIVREVRPTFVFLENVPGLYQRGGIADVLGSLAEGGYDAEWDVFSAAGVGAPHIRQRLFILAWLADPDGYGLQVLESCRLQDPGETLRDDADGRRAGVLPDAEGIHPRRLPERAEETESGPLLGWPPGPRDTRGWKRYLEAGGAEPAVRRETYGGAWRVGELFVLGGGVVPLAAAHAFCALRACALIAAG
jgi:DNA (cytosine-5)-methyltransferase 1